MKYVFPNIAHLDEVLEAIDGREEFIVAEREGFIVLNYMVHLPDSFPQPNTKDSKLNRLYTLRRECRGLKFDTNGKVIARPYHKFFNVNEKPETADNLLTVCDETVILDKLDGSMIHPLFIGDELFWSTKMGLTDIAADAGKFSETNGGYRKFALDCRLDNITPIFEWCSRKQRIVVDYPEDNLILTAMRYNDTGAYITYSDLDIVANNFGIPIVPAWRGDFDGLSSFLLEISGREDEEGYVIRWPDGHMSKAKNEWYCQLHKTKELLTFEKDVIALVLNEKHDDAKAFMDDNDKNRIDAYANELYRQIGISADRLNWIVIAAKDNLNNSKKRFALEVIPEHDTHDKALLYRIWDDNDPLTVVTEHVLGNTGSSTKVEQVRYLIGGIHWKDF